MDNKFNSLLFISKSHSQDMFFVTKNDLVECYYREIAHSPRLTLSALYISTRFPIRLFTLQHDAT